MEVNEVNLSLSYGGVVRTVQGCAAHIIGRLFSLSGLPMVPLLFEIGLDIGPFYVKGLDIGCKFSSSLV